MTIPTMTIAIMTTTVVVLVVACLISNKTKVKKMIEEASNGSAQKQYELGHYYFFKAKDIDEAIFWLACSHVNGFAPATELLNDMESAGVPRFRERFNNAMRQIESGR